MDRIFIYLDFALQDNLQPLQMVVYFKAPKFPLRHHHAGSGMQPPEKFSGEVHVALDIPGPTTYPIAVVNLQATVGMARLHVRIDPEVRNCMLICPLL